MQFREAAVQIYAVFEELLHVKDLLHGRKGKG